ncbi:hypothetical protein [Alloscardovia omnicolens]
MFVDTLQARKELQAERFAHMEALVGLITCGVMSLGSFFYLMLTNANDHPLNSIFAFIVYICATFTLIMLVVVLLDSRESKESSDGE